MNRETVLTYISQSQKLKDAIRNMAPPDYYDDAYSHFLLQMCEMKEEKLIDAYNGGYIDGTCLEVMWNQFKGNNRSTFKKLYINNKTLPVFEDFLNLKDDGDNVIERKMEFERILVLINELMPARHYYHKILFEMYYIDGRTYKGIQEITGINYQSVRLSVLKTIEWIKIHLKNAI